MGRKPFFIAGPCVIESREHSLGIAHKIKKIGDELSVGMIFKSSFDKANRTSLESYRGPGLERGLEILREVKEETGLKVLTDVHETIQVDKAAEVVDILQVPAFLCRQTDLLVACAGTGKTVNVKKGQFVAPHDMVFVVEKLMKSGASEVWLTERGSLFGYGNLVVDMRSIPIMRELGVPVIFDATHSVQKPSADAGKSGGEPQFIATLAKAAAAAGADGFFFETHETPEKALSDGANALKLERFPEMIRKLCEIRSAAE